MIDSLEVVEKEGIVSDETIKFENTRGDSEMAVLSRMDSGSGGSVLKKGTSICDPIIEGKDDNVHLDTRPVAERSPNLLENDKEAESKASQVSTALYGLSGPGAFKRTSLDPPLLVNGVRAMRICRGQVSTLR